MADRYEHGDDHGYPCEPTPVWLTEGGYRLVRLIEGSVNVELPFQYIRKDMHFEFDSKGYTADCDAVKDGGVFWRVRVSL